jgi:hypothetical protein
MDGSSLIFIIVPIAIPIALLTGMALLFIAGSRSGRSHAAGRLASAGALKRIAAARRKARPPKAGVKDTPVEYLYVPCARIRYNGYLAETRRWVQEVPIVKKTAKWIYYSSDTWGRTEAVVSPGCISRQEFETGTRCHDDCPHRAVPCRHGYPAGVIPIPGDRPRPGPAGRLFFATREAAEADLYRGQRERAEQAAREVLLIKELRRAMVDAHPDHGGTAEQFIQARRQYQTALGPARR